MAQSELRRLLGAAFLNAGALVTGGLAGTLIGLVVLSLSARYLGPEEFGRLALTLSAYLLCGRLLIPQTGAAYVKFGAEALASGRTRELGGLLSWCLWREAAGAVLATGIFGGLLAWGAMLGPGAVIASGAGIWFMPAMMLNFTSISAGVLRLGGSFRAMALQPVVTGLTKLVGCALVIGLGLVGLEGFAVAWAAGELAGVLFLGLAAARQWKLAAVPHDPAGPSAAVLWPQMPGFLGIGIAHNAVKSMSRDGDVVLVGILGGAAEAGFYKLVKQVGSALGRTVEPMQQALYPDLARLSAVNDHALLRALVLRVAMYSALIFSGIWVIFLVAGRPAIDMLMGHEYGPVFPAALVYLGATALAMTTATLHPAALALGLPGLSFRVLCASTLAYVLLLLLLVPQSGAVGASFAYVSFYILWAVLMVWAVRRSLSE